MPELKKPVKDNPYAMLLQHDREMSDRMDLLEEKMLSLEAIWQRLLNVTSEPAARAESAPWQPTHAYFDGKTGLPLQQPQPVQSFESLTTEEPEKKPASKKRLGMVIAILVIVALVMAALVLRSKGWGCMLPIG